MASLQARLASLISSIGGDVKALQSATFVGAGWTEEVRTTNYVNSTVTGTDVFTGFTPGANKKYLIHGYLMTVSAATGNGAQFAVLVPTGMTSSACKFVVPLTATTDRVDSLAAGSYSGATTGLVTNTLSLVTAIILVGASPGAGNIRIAGRSETALTNGLTVLPPSVMRWRELA
jgi:hypothetical protein